MCPFHDFDGCSRCKQGTNIDGHIEDGKCRVALVLEFRAVIKVSYHYLQVSFEQTCSGTDEQQGSEHAGQGDRAASQGNGKEKITEKHDKDADGDHFSVSELVGQDAAEERQEVYESEKRAVDEAGSFMGEPEIGSQK